MRIRSDLKIKWLQFLLVFAVFPPLGAQPSDTVHVLFDIDGTFLVLGTGPDQSRIIKVGDDYFHHAKDIGTVFSMISQFPGIKMGFYSGSRTAPEKVNAIRVSPTQTALDLVQGRILNTPEWMMRIADIPEGHIFENFRKDLTLFESNLDNIIIFEDEYSVMPNQFDNLIFIGKVYPDKDLSNKLTVEEWLSLNRAYRMLGIVDYALKQHQTGKSTFAKAAQKANQTPIEMTLRGQNLFRKDRRQNCVQSLN